MRNSPTEIRPGATGSAIDGPGRAAARSDADFANALLELARAARGFRFYPELDPRRRPLVDRAHRALQSELERAGPMDAAIDRDGIRCRIGGAVATTNGPLRDLEAACREHGVERLHFDASLTATAVDGFLDLLARDEESEPDPERMARLLAARDSRGLQINDLVLAAPGAPPAMTPDAVAQRLAELEETLDDALYAQRVGDLVVCLESFEDEDDSVYEALVRLADHAVGAGGRSEEQARCAATGFARLAVGARLDDLIRRATRPGSEGVRAAQLLLQLGESVVAAILDQLGREADAERRAPLQALILTQADTALPGLLEAIRGDDEDRARVAIRLIGELQNPVALPALLESLRVPDLGRRLEAIRALSLMPGEDSRIALSGALASDLEEIASAASQALATCEGSQALPILLDVLEGSVQAYRTALACSVVEVLGRLGDERAVPRLCAILERRPIFRRAHWHAIQLAAVDALSVLPSREARRAVERAARHAAPSVRARAGERIQAPLPAA